MEEGDPGSDSDFEIDTKKEVSDKYINVKPSSVTAVSVTDLNCVSSQAVKQNPNTASSDKATPSRSGPVKKESIGAQYRHHPLRARRRPPKGMYLEQGDIMSLSASQDSGVFTIRHLDTQLVSLKRQVCPQIIIFNRK